MKRTVFTCDRCRSDHRPGEGGTVEVESRQCLKRERKLDLCPLCFDALKKWLERDNTTAPGQDPGMVEECSHHIPCAGPCPQPLYRRR